MGVQVFRNKFSKGVCAARQFLIDNDKLNNEYTCRLDDDCIPEPDYLEKLIEVIDKGYDMATGLIPMLGTPCWKRELRFVRPVICEHKFNDNGELILSKDELAFLYDKEEILPCHQFRTNCLYKSKINKKIKYPINLSMVGFREEGFFSVKAQLAGYIIGCHTGAIAWHIQTASGGCRYPDYAQKVQLVHQMWLDWLKTQWVARGDFFK